MPNPVRAHTIVPNVQLAQATTTLMMQAAFLVAHNLAKAAGWAVQRTNGGGTAGSGDRILVSTDVTIGAAGTGAWAYYTQTIGGDAMSMLLFVDDGAGAIQQIGFRLASGTYSGGNTTTLPTLSGGVETTTRNINLLPFTSDGIVGRYSTWRSTNGSFRMVVKEQGASFTNSWLECFANTDGDGGGQGNFRVALFGCATATGTNCVTFANLIASANWRAITPSGLAVQTTVGESALGRIAGSWTGGHDAFGNLPFSPVIVAATGASGRSMGPNVDVYCVPANAPYGETDSNESGQVQQRKAFGDLAWYWPTGVAIS